MNELEKKEIVDNHALNAHQFLLDFLNKFDTVTRGGIHDFIEITVFNMINSAINDIDKFLSSGHISPSPKEIMFIFADACQKILDNIKRSIEPLDTVKFREA